VPAWIEELPFAMAFTVMLLIVFARAQGTYWLGRGANAGGRRTRLAVRLEGDRMTRATDVLTRRGWPVIPVSFLTVGFQTTVNAAAGFIRMPWLKYTAVMIPGCVAWAAIYSTIGFAAFQGWLALSARSGWTPWVTLVVVVASVVMVLVWRRRRQEPLLPEIQSPSNPTLEHPPPEHQRRLDEIDTAAP